MAKDRKKLQHIHSSVPDKQPTPSTLEVGEIAVNNSKDQEFLSIKNSEDKVVRFSSDEQIVTIMEKKEVMPYVGYVRGETGPSATSADTPTADARGSYGITNNDLLNNKSNIVVKLNQVAAGNTVKHDRVNGAKDAYNKLVNPTTDSGVTDGAGFFIDMSRYAMQDANPSFSSTTNTCRTTMSGTTIIRGLDGACGSLFDIKVNSAKTDIETATTEVTVANTTIGTNSTTISGNTTLNVSGTTTETKKGDVIENNLANKTENTTGVLTENNSSNHVINTTGDTNITRTGVVTEDNKNNVVRTTSGTTTETFKGQVTENNQSGYTINTTGNVITNITGTTTETKVGNVTENHSGTTTETNNGAVTIANNNNKTETTKGNVVENVSGTTTENLSGKLTVNVTGGTEFTSCSAFTVNTNDYKIKQCAGTSGNAEFDFCGGYKINTDNMVISACTTGGTMTVKENAVNVSGGTLTIRESGATDFSGASLTETVTGNSTTTVGGNTTITTSGNTTIHSDGAVGITAKQDITAASSEKDVIITANKNLCATAGDNATIYGEDVTNLGTKCDGTGASTTTNMSGVTINVSGTTFNENIGGNSTVNIGGNETVNVGGAITINSTGNTCINSSAVAAMVGSTKTNVGKNCADGGQTTTLNLNGTTINETGTTVNISGSSNVNVSADTICLSGKTAASMYAPTTNVGTSCGGSSATTINISGTTINEGGTTNNNNFTTINNTATTINNKTTNYNITGTTNINGNTNITGDTYISGVITIGTHCSQLSSTTIADSFCELFNRGQITMTRDSDPSSALSATYKLWQDGVQIGYDIDVPKDQFLKSVDLVDSGNTFYLHFIWYTYDSESHQTSTAETYVNVEDLVKDIDENNSKADRGVNVDVWYNETNKKMNVSADTTIKIGSHTFSKNAAVHSLDSYKLSYSHNGYSGEFDPFVGNSAFTSPHSALTATYGATSGKSGSVTFDTSANKSILIPTCVNHLDRHMITFSSGATSGFSSQTYDPGNDCANSAETINIPTAVSHLNRGKLTIQKNGTNVDTFDPAIDNTINITVPTDASGITTGKLTFTHNGYSGTYDAKTDVTFNTPHSALTISYGENVKCESSSDTYNTSAAKTVKIPTQVSHIGRETIDFSAGTFTAKSYDPGNSCSGKTTVNVPTSIEHLEEWSQNCFTIDNNLCVTGNITATGGVFSTSDERKKEDIEFIVQDDKLKVRNIPLKSFKFKDDNTKRKVYGIIAQEAEAAGLDEIVHTDEQGMKSVDYTSFLILRIAYLEKMIGHMHSKIAQLEKQLNEK